MKSIYFLLFTAIVFGNVFISTIIQWRNSPPNTEFVFAEGFLPDYYQYLSWIESGSLGQVLLDSRYRATAQPHVLVHPLFSITGIIAGFFNLSTPIAYLVLRAVSLLAFFFTLYQLMSMLFPSTLRRAIGLLLFLFGTGFETVPWSNHFGIISKYSLPPHHLLALAAWMGMIIAFAKRSLGRSVVLGWCLALLNPSIFLFSLLFLAPSVKRMGRHFMILLVSTSPILLYTMFILGSVPPWSIMYERMLHFNPPTTYLNYILSLGPLFPLSAIGVWIMRKKLSFVFITLITWAYVPILLFPLVGTVLPINYSRLLQTYQYIPITLLAVFFIRKFASALVITAVLLYGVIVYVTTMKTLLKPHNLSSYNVFVPKPLLSAFRFLNTFPNEHVVVSGEYVSQMIPAFTKHRSVIGRDDSVADYYPLRDRVFAFIDGRMNQEDALDFVREQKVNYVLFGVDTKPLSALPTNKYRFLVPTFTDENVSVVAVDTSLVPGRSVDTKRMEDIQQ